EVENGKVRFGGNDAAALDTMEQFYRSCVEAPFFRTTIENAELIKVAYNTFIGMKIAFANTMMEICHKIPNTDVDEVTRALRLGTVRLLSDKYLYGGMGDGGGCHPRDNIALSWLSQKLELSYDWFHNVMLAREKQTEWLAQLLCSYNLPKMILGYSFKPETNITVGSPALLLKTLVEHRGVTVTLHDPLVEGRILDTESLPPHVFLLGTNHQIFQKYRFPRGSVVLDPWRSLSTKIDGVTVVPIGRSGQNIVPADLKVETPRLQCNVPPPLGCATELLL
ncbi:MAG: hypothetical protein EBZ48_17475, partial [Proteobacteria bacterium]|nr:hypothetical protein [Pseudomonadota bacterium]